VRKFFFLFLFLVQINVYSQSPPKNIIIMIGDGMGVNYVTSSVLSLKNDPFRRFTTTGFSVTCSADNLITDSAAGGTAIATGQRTNNYFISIHPETEAPLLTILEYAERINKSTGIVVTSSITHATPASFVAHVKHRNMEIEIAKYFTELDLEVVIGGGSKFFMPKSLGGDRTDEQNLITGLTGRGYSYYKNYDELKNNKPEGKFYALLEPNGLLKAEDRNYSLSDLVKIALGNLSKDEDGFILMIEGSQIDWAGHQNNQDYLLSEQKDFNGAINTVLDFAEQNGETIVIVTADHETGGMGIVDGNPDGCDLDVEFLNKHHTADMVGIFAKGPGEGEFSGVMDNYMIGRKLFKLLDNSYQF
jgi:alkaline phosphatase